MTEQKKRFEDLSNRAYEREYCVYSDFLGLSEISELKSIKYNTPYFLWGGYESAERSVACFGDREYFENCDDFPIDCILIEPLNQKFADTLTHRDFLGSLMGLGIKREIIGDIIISENCGYVFCIDSISGYIIDNLQKVRHTSVKCSITKSFPENTVKPVDSEYIVSSERIDVIVSAVYNLSRSTSQKLFESEKIFINGSEKNNTSYMVKIGDIISVRGYGRFIYNGIKRKTKKERLLIGVSIYK